MSLDQFMLKPHTYACAHTDTPLQPHTDPGDAKCSTLHLKFRVLHSLRDQALSNSTGFLVFVLSSGKYTFT